MSQKKLEAESICIYIYIYKLIINNFLSILSGCSGEATGLVTAKIHVLWWHDDINSNNYEQVVTSSRAGRTRRLPRAFSADVWSQGWVTLTKLLSISWSILIWLIMWIYVIYMPQPFGPKVDISWSFYGIWSYGGSWGGRESKTTIWSRPSEQSMRRKFSTQEAFSIIILEQSTMRIVRSLCINLGHLLIVSLHLHMSELFLFLQCLPVGRLLRSYDSPWWH